MFTQNRVAELPGYTPAQIQVISRTGVVLYTFGFAISPNSLRIDHSNTLGTLSTNAGWVVQRGGKSPINISFSGVMLDVRNQLERHIFMENYKTYIEDSRTNELLHYNANATKLIVEGREYMGVMSSIGFSKASNTPFLYQYTIAFVAFNERQMYGSSGKYTQVFSGTLPERPYVEEKTVDKTNLSDLVAGEVIDLFSGVEMIYPPFEKNNPSESMLGSGVEAQIQRIVDGLLEHGTTKYVISGNVSDVKLLEEALKNSGQSALLSIAPVFGGAHSSVNENTIEKITEALLDYYEVGVSESISEIVSSYVGR